VERLTSAKEDLTGQLRDKDTELASVKDETYHVANALGRYQSQHIRSAEMLRDDVLELLAQAPTNFVPPMYRRRLLRVGEFLL
jgi:hypothetical protein